MGFLFVQTDYSTQITTEQTVAYIRKNSINEYVAIIEELEGEKKIRPDDKTIMIIDF